MEAQKQLLDFQQHSESASIIPEHIQQLADCMKVDGLSVFIEFHPKEMFCLFGPNDVFSSVEFQLVTPPSTLMHETITFHNPRFRESVSLQKPELKNLQRVVASPSFNDENRSRFDVVMVENEAYIVLQNASQVGHILVWFAKGFRFVRVRRRTNMCVNSENTHVQTESVQRSRLETKTRSINPKSSRSTVFLQYFEVLRD